MTQMKIFIPGNNTEMARFKSRIANLKSATNTLAWESAKKLRDMHDIRLRRRWVESQMRKYRRELAISR